MPVICPFNPRFLVALAILLPATACSAVKPGARNVAPEGKVITAEQIKRSGATNGWEALKRSGTHLSMRENARGEPSRLSYRGHNSIVLSNTPVLYVDGAQMASFNYLRELPADIIARIRVFSGVSGTKYFGTGGGNGVILVETRATLASKS